MLYPCLRSTVHRLCLASISPSVAVGGILELSEAEAIIARAQATARGLTLLSQSLNETGRVEAASMRVAEQYIQAFGNITKEGITMLLPSSAANPASMIAQAFDNVQKPRPQW